MGINLLPPAPLQTSSAGRAMTFMTAPQSSGSSGWPPSWRSAEQVHDGRGEPGWVVCGAGVQSEGAHEEGQGSRGAAQRSMWVC